MSNKSALAYLLIGFSFFISIFFIINPDILLPAGYELAIDGYVISRTLLIIFVLSLLFKLGLVLSKQTEK